MNKVNMIVTEKEYGRFEAKFEVVGDIWEWLKSNKSDRAYRVSEDVRSGEIHEFYYESQLDKFIKANKGLCTVIR